jgi:predicted nucleic acid-binding protein
LDTGNPWVTAFVAHVEARDDIVLVGPVLQELLTGLRRQQDFERLLLTLSDLPLLRPSRQTYVEAAKISNACRRRGVQTNAVDCLIAASCVQHDYPLLTADRDFARIAEHSGLVLLPPSP